MIAEIAGKTINVQHIDGPLGVRGRNSDNNLMFEKLNWKPTQPLETGLRHTYKWICQQVADTNNNLISQSAKNKNSQNTHA